MDSLIVSFMLLSGVVGAGLASGREVVRFFACHGVFCVPAVLAAVFTLCALFLRLSGRMAEHHAASLTALCRQRLGERFGLFCAALFFLLTIVTAGAMLAALGELSALLFPLRCAEWLGIVVLLPLAFLCSHPGGAGLLPGVALCVLFSALLCRLLRLPADSVFFLRPSFSADQPLRALADGAIYGALNAAMLAGLMPALSGLPRRVRTRSVLRFGLLLLALLLPAALVCRAHLAAIREQPLPFVYLMRETGGGYVLLVLCMACAAFTTLCAMQRAACLLLPPRVPGVLVAALTLAFSMLGFTPLVGAAYPMLGAVCMGLLLLLCLR